MESSSCSSSSSWTLVLPFLAGLLSAECGAAWEHSHAAAMVSLALLLVLVSVLSAWLVPGGTAWGRRCVNKQQTIPGPRGWPLLGSLFQMGGQAHRSLAKLAREYDAKELMAFSIGNTRMIVTSQPEVARELLNSSAFANRPLKQSAEQLLFARAIGFAPYGVYWRNLRRIASSYLFSPRQIAAQEPARQLETSRMVDAIATLAAAGEAVQVRDFLQRASLHTIMQTVFGRRYEDGSKNATELRDMVREGFELLGAFNWGDHLPALQSLDPQNILHRCANLSRAVSAFVQKIIDEHRKQQQQQQQPDFVNVLLSLEGEEKLEDADIVAVLWEMIFRGTDTVALLVEWVLAELVLHPDIQRRLHRELDQVVGTSRQVSDSDISRLQLLPAVVKEALRMHPPGPLLSWARLAVHDVNLAGHHVPAGTTAMVNMWSITHDPSIWPEPDTFKPDRFLEHDLDIKGTDLRLAPFGAGRRVCPGRALGLATVHLWIGRLLQNFEWEADPRSPVSLTEVLKLSSEMASPLRARALPRMKV